MPHIFETRSLITVVIKLSHWSLSTAI